MGDEPIQVPNPIQWGYSDDIIEITDIPAPQKKVQNVEVIQQIQIPIGAFDEIVKEYISRREGFLSRGLVSGVLFDDGNDSGF